MSKTKTSSKTLKKSPKAQNSQKSQKNQKSHRGVKITAIIIVILLLIFGGLAIWFFAYYNNPEKVAFDAIEHLLSADNVGLDGEFVLMAAGDEKADSPISSVYLSFDSSSNRLPASNTATLNIFFNPEVVQGEPKISLKLSNVVLKDGVLYFQIGGIIDSLNSFSLKADEWEAIESYIPLLETIDNEWWQIDINHIISELELPAAQKDTVAQIYSCVVQAMNRNDSAEMAKLYDEHRFIVITPSDYIKTSGNNTYAVAFERYKLTDFLNAIPETAAANEFYACFNAVENETAVPLSIDASAFDEISPDDVEFPKGMYFHIEVSTFGHQLNRIHVYQNTDDYTLNGQISFKYQYVNVSAPTEFRPITDLIEEFIELLEEM